MVSRTALLGAAVAWFSSTCLAQNASMPTVDLGYEIHQAIAFNETGQYYNFSNIRYAAPPLGELRFAAPQAPATNRSEVQVGDKAVICPQAGPAWFSIASEFVPDYLEGKPFNYTPSSNSTPQLPPVDPRTSEDCLFLDVMVPKNIFDNRNSSSNSSGAPVLVWIYGGGYTEGDKTDSGNPAGLIHRAQNGLVYVALNYRLGAFGFLSGPSLQANGTANAGLHDQRFALEWVQQNIHLFGGDPSKVTVIGESAGGGSIMHQITAYGGKNGPAPFAQAIPQSAAFEPIVSNLLQEQILDTFLTYLDVDTIEEARQMPTEKLQLANTLQVGVSTYGQFTYGPTVDGDFVPALPGLLLLHGQFDKSVKLMIGHNSDEGILFTSPFVTNETTFEKLQTNFFTNPLVLNYLDNVLYPAVFDGTYGYKDQIGRTALFTSEFSFICNSYYMATAFQNQTYDYLFSVPPGVHGQDIPYTFYNGPDDGPDSLSYNTTVALLLQDYIVSFAETGTPTMDGVPHFVMYGENATVQNLGDSGISGIRDPAANSRCDYWQKAIWY